MFDNGLRPAKLPTALALGALLIFLSVFICNISKGLSNSAVFSIRFEKKSLAQAMEILANSTQTQITLIGDIESTALNSMQIESQGLAEIIKTILKRYGAENYAVIYDDKGKAIKIRLLASSSTRENHFYPSDQAMVNGQLTPTRMFSEQDFARLLGKQGAAPPQREFSKEDFERLREKNTPLAEPREFSAEDFSKLEAQKTEIKQHRIFTSDDFARVSEKSDLQAEDKLFSDEDFSNVLKNQQQAPIDPNGNITQ